MRFIPILIILVALAASAGCFGKDKGDDSDPTPTPTPGGTPATTTRPATTPTPPTANTTPTAPAKPAPKELCAVAGTFSDNVHPGAPPTFTKTAACGLVSAGYTSVTMNLTFTATQGAPVFLTQGVSLALIDAAGTAAATCTGPSAGQAAATAVTCTGTVMAGDYSLQFNGAGDIDVAGTVQIA